MTLKLHINGVLVRFDSDGEDIYASSFLEDHNQPEKGMLFYTKICKHKSINNKGSISEVGSKHRLKKFAEKHLKEILNPLTTPGYHCPGTEHREEMKLKTREIFSI